MMDHGGLSRFYLNGNTQIVGPADLDSWLGTLEDKVANLPVNLILDACHSGSFIHYSTAASNNAPFPSLLSKPGRVVIASTASHSLAYPTLNGAIFSDAFLAALENDSTLFTAFQEGRWTAHAAHSDQNAWLDDNGDGVPNTLLDGVEAQKRGFTYGKFADVWPPYIAHASVETVANGQGVIEADVRDDTGVLTVYAVIYPPSYIPPSSDLEEMPDEHLPTVTLLDANHDGIFSALYQNFTEIGPYRIVVYAIDNDTLQARPLDFIVRTGWKVFVPVVMGGE
jgi:hypothetical protein